MKEDEQTLLISAALKGFITEIVDLLIMTGAALNARSKVFSERIVYKSKVYSISFLIILHGSTPLLIKAAFEAGLIMFRRSNFFSRDAPALN